jgi:hypothetical protein
LSDNFMERLGEAIAGFAWLEDLLGKFIQTLCGTKKAAVFTRRMTFRTKCDKLKELLKFTTDEQYAADVRAWIKECRAAAEDRNAAVHSKHLRFLRGWGRDDGDKLTDVSAEQLADLHARIKALYDRGVGYEMALRSDEIHRQIAEDDARLDAILELMQDAEAED